MKVRGVVVMLAVVAALWPVAHAEAAGPARSGTIVGGYMPYAAFLIGSPPCSKAPDCAVWLASGCDPALAGRDPGLISSIVDVASIARTGKIRRFRLFTDQSLTGVVVQFWDRRCREVRASPAVRPGFGSSDGFLGGGPHFRGSARLKVPRSARWMTVAAANSTLVKWQLT